MKWEGRQRSRNVEDRRGLSPGGLAAGGGGIGVLILLILMVLSGNREGAEALLKDQMNGGGAAAQVQKRGEVPPPDDKTREFIEVVLRDTEVIWTELFRQQGERYEAPKLVIFSGTDKSACGVAKQEFGPFYCPTDRQVYIDPSFFDQLARRHRAPGDFAQAYVIAHEVAHHVQVLTGYSDKVNRVRTSGDTLASNRASVRLELQADYLAGVWAHHAHKNFEILEPGDINEAITAANQIGDDTLMKEATGYVVPERFTHGTSEQRVRWFTRGLKTGDFEACADLFTLDYNDLAP